MDKPISKDKNSPQTSIFDDMGDGTGVEIPEPIAEKAPKWSAYQKLNLEKEVVGIYITGHPLEDFKLEVDNFCDVNLKSFVRAYQSTTR